MNIRRLLFSLSLCLLISVTASAQGTRLLRHPTVSRDLVAFEYAGDLWVVSRSGGQARRLTSTPGVEIDPYFSPDGTQIAFTATVAGNTDVYVVPTAGGDPKRLTYHPGLDRVRGWTPDGRRVTYEEITTAFVPEWYEASMWRRYRGGRTHPISVMNLADYSVEKLPWNNSNDTLPMWVGNTIYFLSDRDGTEN